MSANARERDRETRAGDPVSTRGEGGRVGEGRRTAAPEAWARLSEVLAKETDPERLCAETCRLLVERFGFARALVATIGGERDRLVTRAGHDPAVPAPVRAALSRLFTIPLQPQEDGRYLVAAWCVLHDEQVHVGDAASYDFRPDETAQRPLLVKVFGTREYALTPVRGPGGVVGLIGVDRRGEEPGIDPDDLRTLRAVGDLLGVALAARDGGPAAFGRGREDPEPEGATTIRPGTVRPGGELLTEMLDALHEGLVLVAPDDTVRYLNRSASSLLEVLPWDVLGHRLDSLLPAAAVTSDLPEGGWGRRPGGLRRFRTPTGRLVEAVQERLGVSGPGPGSWSVFFLVDVTERLEEERSRDEFLASLVHDLTAPLQSVVGFAELLLMGRAGELNEPQRDFVERIEKSGWEVSSLLADIRALADLQTGRACLAIERVDPFPLVQGVLEDLADEAEKARVEVVNEVPPDLPTLRVDASRVTEALRRLGQGGIEAAEPGDVVVISGEVGEGDDRVRLRVSGPGAESNLEYLRRLLHRRALMGGRAARRSGLGVLLARAVAEAHGGEAWVEPGFREGAAVVLSLPRATDGS